MKCYTSQTEKSRTWLQLQSKTENGGMTEFVTTPTATSRGLLERLGLLVHRLATLLLRYSCSHCARGGSRDHNWDIRRAAPTAASIGDARTPNRIESSRLGLAAPTVSHVTQTCT